MDTKELKKMLKCISLSGLIVASGGILSSCRTSSDKKGVESEKEKTSCSGGEKDEGKTSCSGGEGGTSCG